MELDAIIISDSGNDSVSGTNPLKLHISNYVGSVQVINNYIQHEGRLVEPIEGDGLMSWESAPKLNGLYLLSALLKDNFNVELIDRYYEQKKEFRQLLKKSPKVVIISTSFIYRKQALYNLVRDIRDLAQDIFIIVGGPFIYASYLLLQRVKQPDYDTDSAANDYLFLDIKQEPLVDLYIVSQRGERILSEALKKLKKGIFKNNLPNTAQLINNYYYFTKRVNDSPGNSIKKIDWLSLPDHLFKSKVLPMQASIGCPYRCNFCNFTKDVGMMSIKSTNDLVEELKTAEKKDINYVWFVDDNFRLGKNDLNTVCETFIRKDIQIKWMTFIRASTLEKVDVELLKKANCVEVQLGLESADKQVLKNMNKKSDPSLYFNVVKNLLRVGINCSCYFIFGFPGETEESVKRTTDFIKSIEFSEYEGNLSWSLFPFILNPLSPIYDLKMRNNFNLSGYLFNWKHSTMDSIQAKEQVLKTFYELENSGPIYRSDNLKMLTEMNHQNRKRFYNTRHALSKMALNRELKSSDVLSNFIDFL